MGPVVEVVKLSSSDRCKLPLPSCTSNISSRDHHADGVLTYHEVGQKIERLLKYTARAGSGEDRQKSVQRIDCGLASCAPSCRGCAASFPAIAIIFRPAHGYANGFQCWLFVAAANRTGAHGSDAAETSTRDQCRGHVAGSEAAQTLR
eukprot:COSAG01_NODE_13922_length_1517_cov_1.812412_2_plen_148_part_00